MHFSERSVSGGELSRVSHPWRMILRAVRLGLVTRVVVEGDLERREEQHEQLEGSIINGDGGGCLEDPSGDMCRRACGVQDTQGQRTGKGEGLVSGGCAQM